MCNAPRCPRGCYFGCNDLIVSEQLYCNSKTEKLWSFAETCGSVSTCRTKKGFSVCPPSCNECGTLGAMCTWRRPGYELLPVLVLLCGIATSSTFLRCPYWSTKTHRFSGVGRASLSGLEDRHSFLISTACSSRRSKALSRLSNVCAPQVRIFERDQDGARGCYTSHLSVYKEALQKGLSWAMILEDNLMLTQEPLEVQNSLAGLLEWLSTSPARGTQWSIVHLSLVHSAASLRLRSPQDLPYGQLVKVERTAPDWYGPVQIKRPPGLGTTAYLVSRDAMQAILDYDSRRGYVAPIDDVLAEACFNLGCLMLFAFSDQWCSQTRHE